MNFTSSMLLALLYIDFYTNLNRWLCANSIEKSILDKTHIFNSFFYEQLSRKDDKGYFIFIFTQFNMNRAVYSAPGYDRIKNWTNKVDIFSKEYLIIPINEQ